MSDKSALILVIDDEEDIRLAIVRVLSDYNVITAEDGRKGLELLKSEKVNLIITDIVMPEMQGIEFINMLNKQKKYIPVIIMSGNIVGREYLEAAKLLGAAATFEKPFDFKELKKSVDEITNQL